MFLSVWSAVILACRYYFLSKIKKYRTCCSCFHVFCSKTHTAYSIPKRTIIITNFLLVLINKWKSLKLFRKSFWWLCSKLAPIMTSYTLIRNKKDGQKNVQNLTKNNTCQHFCFSQQAKNTRAKFSNLQTHSHPHLIHLFVQHTRTHTHIQTNTCF